MARKIIWTDVAEIQLEEILSFWVDYTKSYSYTLKLAMTIKEKVNWISETNFKGIPSYSKNISVTFFENYSIFYILELSELIILAIWDTRRNPEDRPYNF